MARLRRERTEQLKGTLQLLYDLTGKDDADLAAHLKAPDPELRLAAVVAVSLKRRHLESSLIDLLNDRNAVVRQNAHQALVRLARGTDLGPERTDGKTRRRQAVQRWRDWLALQQSEAAGRRLQPAAGEPLAAAPAKPVPAAPALAQPAAASDPGTATLAAVHVENMDAETERLANELVRAPLENRPTSCPGCATARASSTPTRSPWPSRNCPPTHRPRPATPWPSASRA